MGFFDDIQGAVDRGMSSMERSVEIAKINARLREINQQRTNLAAQLGACLYEKTKNDPAFIAGLETLYNDIAKLDADRSEAQDLIEKLQNQAQQQAAAKQLITCPTCGTDCDPNDMFCCGCGAKVATFASAATVADAKPAPRCPKCGTPAEEGDTFCMSCGTRLANEQHTPAPAIPLEPAIEPEPAPEPVSETVLTLDPAIAPIEPEPSPAPVNDVVLTFEPTIAPVEPQPEPEPEPELNFVRTPDVEDDEDLELTLVMDPETANETPVAPEPEIPVPAPSLVVESFVVPQPETANGASSEPNTVAAPADPEPAPAPQLTFEPLGDDSGIDLSATLQPFLPIDEKAEPALQPVAPVREPEPAPAPAHPVSGLIFDSPVIPPTPKPQPEPQTENPAPQKRFCPNCGKVITPGDRFCMSCGSNLDGIW